MGDETLSQSSQRINIASGSPWEDKVGYSRAVRIGNVVEVAGTTAVDEQGQVVGLNDPYEQTRFILTRIANALASVGAGLQDVVRTRMFVTDISRWQEVGRAHGEVFRDIRPVATMVEVRALISPELLVEIEVTAVIREADSH
jgi:enamine deaminase RidA (YjgF/YER057c/UK114 family)